MNDARDFIHDDFLLDHSFSSQLYHAYAEQLPIIDYHCHLSPALVARNQRFTSITQLWLDGDHYKWRAMRSNGIDERFCTGDASHWEKFEAFAATIPYALRNPLYHWTHLELKRYFGISQLLSPATAREIYERCNEVIAHGDFSVQTLIKRSRVRLICTTDDPVDSLEHHAAFARNRDNNDFQMVPAWRPDKGMAIENTEDFNAWIQKLEQAAGIEIDDFNRYLQALEKRHAFFHQMGCRLSDHGLETVYAENYTHAEVAGIFAKVRAGQQATPGEVLIFKSAMLYEFAVMDAARGWVQQFHLGALRNNNLRMLKRLGPDTGYDSIGDFELARPLSRLLGRLDCEGKLAKTILYNLNPRDNELIATMLGNFQEGPTPGKLQMGSGWWFLDQMDGMKRQIEALSQLGLLRRFVGMLTDSRSFLSYTRHEYFRRLLCSILGEDMHRGHLPADMQLIGQMVQDICYNNAACYFGFDLEPLADHP